MNVIEFYSGTQELAKTFRARGHNVITLDIDPKTKPDMCMDILELNAEEFKGGADVTWFSPAPGLCKYIVDVCEKELA